LFFEGLVTVIVAPAAARTFRWGARGPQRSCV